MHSLLRRAVRWGIVAMIVVSLYVLSVGPADYFVRKTGGNGEGFFRVFYAPLEWIADNTSLGKGLNDYVGLFIDETDLDLLEK